MIILIIKTSIKLFKHNTFDTFQILYIFHVNVMEKLDYAKFFNISFPCFKQRLVYPPKSISAFTGEVVSVIQTESVVQTWVTTTLIDVKFTVGSGIAR